MVILRLETKIIYRILFFVAHPRKPPPPTHTPPCSHSHCSLSTYQLSCALSPTAPPSLSLCPISQLLPPAFPLPPSLPPSAESARTVPSCDRMPSPTHYPHPVLGQGDTLLLRPPNAQRCPPPPFPLPSHPPRPLTTTTTITTTTSTNNKKNTTPANNKKKPPTKRLALFADTILAKVNAQFFL